MIITNPAAPLILMDRPPAITDGGYLEGTIWVDRVNLNTYVCFDPTLGAAIWRQVGYRTTIISVTAQIAAETAFSTTANGTGYTKSGDDGYLLETAALFNVARDIQIYLNGVLQRKASGSTWLSSTSFKIYTIVDNGDEIIILS